ncbi:MAG: RDD family protein [Chitinophagales bacterium]|nr:RDD family protein [Chitinophagales bacterium]
MRTIDINTTQNVTIQYALATVRDRMFAFMVDMILMFGVLAILSLLMAWLFSSSGFSVYIIPIVNILIFVFYSLTFEMLMNGQSVGKRLLGLKIVKITGKEPTGNDYVVRWAFRFIDIWCSLGSIAVMMISSTERSQRLGDLLANTAVIKLNPWSSVNLNEILSMKTIEDYKPVYPDVKKFSEQDMLLIKQAVDRVKNHNNIAHSEAITILADRMAEQLSLSKTPFDKIQFLKTLVSDYVVMSR